MIYTIESDQLQVKVKSLGAELTSIKGKTNGIEYLWQGDAAIWESQAPVLFPSVGRMKEFEYYYKGVRYDMGLHGFARHSEFAVKEEPGKLTFSLTHNDVSMKNYPFEFLLEVIFTLDGSRLNTEYRVTNTSASEVLHFGIGAHPGFNVPLVAGTEFTDYYLEFEGYNSLTHYKFVSPGLFLENETLEIPLENSCLPLSYEVFEKTRTVMLKDTDIKKVAIKSKKCPHYVSMQHESQHLAIWTAPGPYVCLEPWDGLPDYLSTDGDFANKRGNHKLPPGQAKSFKHEVEFF